MHEGTKGTSELLGHAGWLQGLARRLVGDAGADDAVQAVWLRAAERPPAELSSPRGWLRSTLRSVHVRGEEKRSAVQAREQSVARVEALPSVEELAEKAEAQKLLVAAVLQLGEPEREAVLLHFFEGLSAAEIARRSGMPSSTVRTRIGRGVDQLRERLDQSQGGASVWAPSIALLLPRGGASPSVGAALGPSLLTLGTAVMWKLGLSIGGSILGILLLAWGGGMLDGDRPDGSGLVAPSKAQGESRGDSDSAETAGATVVVEPPADPGQRVELEGAGHVVAVPTEGPGAATNTAVLRGRVVDPNGVPAGGATVYEGTVAQVNLAVKFSSRERRLSAKVDAEGRFELEVEASGPVLLCAGAEGFVLSEAHPVEATAGPSAEEILLVLREGATITGTVVDKEQWPIEGRTVHLSCSGVGENRKVVTDKDGRFVLSAMIPGSWRAATFPSDQELIDAGEGTDPASAVAHLKQAEFVLVDGESVDVALGVVSVDAPRIRGTLRHMGEPIGGLMQWYPAARTTEKMVSRAGVDGAFEVDLPAPGRWIVHVNVKDAPSRGQRIGYDFAAGERRELDIDLRGASAAGVVVGPDGELLSRSEVELRTVATAPHLPNPTQGGARVRTDKNGAYRFELLPPGSYVVVAHGYLSRRKGLTRGATRSEPFELTGEEALEVPSIHVSEGTSVPIRVRDANGRPVSGASVFLYDAAGYCLNPTTSTHTNGKGEAASPSLPKGPVWVTATHRSGACVPQRVTVGTDNAANLVLGPAHWVELDGGTDWIDETQSHISITDEAGRQWTSLFDLSRLFEARPHRDKAAGPMFGQLPEGNYRISVSRPGRKTLHGAALLKGSTDKLTTVVLE